MKSLSSLGIRYKLFLILSAIALAPFTLLLVAALNIPTLLSNAELITDEESPRISGLNDAAGHLVRAEQAFSTALLADSFTDGVEELQDSESQFRSAVLNFRMYLAALKYGSESEAFKAEAAGLLYGEWLRQHLDAQLPIPVASPEITATLEVVSQLFEEYSVAAVRTITSHKKLLRLQAYGDTSDPVLVEEIARLEEEVESHERHTLAVFADAFDQLSDTADHSGNVIRRTAEYIGQFQENRLFTLFVVALLGFIFSIALGLFFGVKFIMRPIGEISEVVAEVATGTFSRRVEVRGHDEIALLAKGVNDMTTRLEDLYTNLERKVGERTERINAQNLELRRARSATINLLEDLDEEKSKIEEKIKERTKELEEEKHKLLKVTSNMRGGGMLLNAAQEPVFVNRRMGELLEAPEGADEEAVYKIFLKTFEGTAIMNALQKQVFPKGSELLEVETKNKIFEVFLHQIADSEHDKAGEATLFILLYDITETRLLERSKSELVAVASHQLRTPLTAMRGNVEMLVDESFGPLTDGQHELLVDIEASTERLIMMVNDMLDITKIEKGNFEMKIEPLNVTETIESIMEDLYDYAKRHQFTINHEKPPQPITVYGDTVRVRQVMQNLIDNSIKYSKHPGTLTISYTEAEDHVEIIFKDDGIGIPKAEHSKMFDKFYRASNTAKTTSSGSGLGLYIVKSIVEQLGGSIRFESVEEVGTAFFVTLPTIEMSKHKDV